MTERLDATIRGSVQGVGFRWFVQRTAQRLGLTGWTANQADGTVTVIAEGPTGALDALAEALARGPSGARVTAVDVRRVPATDEFAEFTIRAAAHRGD